MTIEAYENLVEKFSIAENVHRSWKHYGKKVNELINDFIWPSLCQLPMSYRYMLAHDEENIEKLFSMFQEIKNFISENEKAWENRASVTEDALYTPEAKEVARLYELDDRDIEEQEIDSGYPEDKSWEEYTRTEILGLKNYC